MTQHTASPSAKLVAEAKSATKSFGSRPIVSDLSLRVQRGDRLAIVGPNGAGKTTLLNLLTGALKPESGSIRLGTNIKLVALDQRRDRLDPSMSLRHTLTGGGSDMVETAGGSRHVIGHMKDFLFSPEQAGTPVGVLSGGERGRLMLAIGLAAPSNLLVLDEPTNDLDLETLDLLQELLADYSGTVLLVSHDRDFIDRVATSVLAFEEDGVWIEYAGDYSDMVAQRGTGVSPLANLQETPPGANEANRHRETSTPDHPGPSGQRTFGQKSSGPRASGLQGEACAQRVARSHRNAGARVKNAGRASLGPCPLQARPGRVQRRGRTTQGRAARTWQRRGRVACLGDSAGRTGRSSPDSSRRVLK